MSREYKSRKYKLSDGKTWTLKEIVELSGLGRETIYYRLQKSNNKEFIFEKPHQHRLRDIKKRAEHWVDKPTEVYFGIPMNPSYMDGLRDRDRDGEPMSESEQANLMHYRDYNRKMWLKERANIIGERK